jgi:outer membrane protein TolC
VKSSARFGLGFALLLPLASSAAFAQTAPAPAVAAASDVPKLDTQLSGLLGRPGGLTSDQAAVRARATSYDVAARRAEYEASQSTVDQANAAYVPRIKGTAGYQRTSLVTLNLAAFGFPGSFAYPQDNWNLQVDVDVPVSDYVLKIAKQHAAAEHNANAAKLTERAAKLTASSNARIQYYSWTRARLQEVVATDALEQARAHVGDAKAEFDAGKASQADLMAVQAQVAQNELLVVRATNAASLEEDRLRTAMHDPPGARYEIGEPLLADLPPVPGESDFNALLNEALSERAELKSLGEAARGLRAQAAASRYDILPKLDGIGQAIYANPNPKYFPPESVWNGTWAVGGAITWSDVDVLLGATNGSANEAKARSTEAQALAMRDGIRDDVLAAWQSVKEAEVAIDSTQRSLASAEESYRVRRALFRADRSTSTELTDSENALTGARFDAVNARIDLRIARVRLTHATGRDDTGQRQDSASD